jgi:hypothetical protein
MFNPYITVTALHKQRPAAIPVLLSSEFVTMHGMLAQLLVARQCAFKE